jgi:hypothetical protein
MAVRLRICSTAPSQVGSALHGKWQDLRTCSTRRCGACREATAKEKGSLRSPLQWVERQSRTGLNQRRNLARQIADEHIACRTLKNSQQSSGPRQIFGRYRSSPIIGNFRIPLRLPAALRSSGETIALRTRSTGADPTNEDSHRRRSLTHG